MKIIYIDFTSGDIYDAKGAPFANQNQLISYLENTEDYEIHYVTDGGTSETPSEWTPYTGFENISVSSLFAIDNNFISSYKGKTVSAIESGGSVSSISAEVTAEERYIPKTGILVLRNASGEEQSFAYVSRSAIEKGYAFTLGAAETADYAFEEGATVSVPESLMILAEGDYDAETNAVNYVDDSRKSEGIFGVHFLTMSDKLMENFEFTNTESLQLTAEHAILSNGETIKRFQFRIYINKPIAFQRSADVPESNAMGIASQSWVLSLLRNKFEFQFSADGSTDWHDIQNQETDQYYRQRISVVGADWSDKIMIPKGEKGDKGDRGEAGADGLTPEIDPDTKHWMIGGSDTGVVAEAKLEGGTAEITEVADNIATLSGTNVPVGVRTNSGTYYPIEKGSVVIDITNGQIKLDVTPYLAYDNAASFTGPWTVYYAAGSKGDKGDNALSFQIGTVTTLAAGASATAEAAISDEGLVTLNLGIPQGANGADGQDGSDGEDADATAAIDAHNSDASAHTAIQNKFASYLPLAGGTMTGVINRNGALVQNTVSGGSVSLIASHTGATEKGAALYLWDEANSTYPGYFILRAGHTSGYSDLRGTAPGGLTWRGASLIGECSKTMNGYTKLPNGIIIQWGSTSSTASSVSATFPVAFTAAPIVIPHSPSDGVGIAVSATTTSATFTISSGSINVRYIAIGY